ncbi:MAG TPA: hypothetical protein VD978_21420 [Azospirillum sp.]|nr:hypothetical protein [Azospirillum sp.]
MKTRTIVSLALAALAACAGPQAEQAIRAQQTLVGMPKGDLLACAGVPQRSIVGPDGTEYLIYGREQINIHRDYDPPGFGGPFSIFGEVDTWTTEYSCVATFALRQGRVAELRYNENRDIQLCYQMIGNCLPPAGRLR